MDPFNSAEALKQVGRFSEALHVLAGATLKSSARLRADVLRAELLEKTGQHEAARTLAMTLLASRQLTDSERSACECVIANVLIEIGDIDSGVAYLQRAASRCEAAVDRRLLFAARLTLFNVLAERLEPGAATAVLAEVRQLATKLGDPHCTANLHLWVSEAEAKRGLFDNARRHVAVARRILTACPHVYLEAFADNVDLAVSVLRSRFDVARLHGVRAAQMAAESGVASIVRASLSNLGNLYYAVGDYDRAIEYFGGALRALKNSGARCNAARDSIARVRLAQGCLDECRSLLDSIDASIRTEADRVLYGHRYAELTRAQLLAAQGDFTAAIAKCNSVLALAERAGDAFLMKKGRLTKAEFLQRASLPSDALNVLKAALPELVGESPELTAHSEQILACILAADGDVATGSLHHNRAARIYASLQSVTARKAMEQSWHPLTTGREESQLPGRELPEMRAAAAALQSIAIAVTHPDRPELVARELLDVLVASGGLVAGQAISVSGSQPEQTVVASYARPGATPSPVDTELFEVGTEDDKVVKLVLRTKSDGDSVASVNAIRLLLAAIHELERSRAEREERATLWPVDELSVDGDPSVISGHMRELMNYARRIAKTDVNVLITGESGTGKEILARAIHNFSNRADKPFVPFNCTAVPRDLLESQLFGHRRGAFTGADRDYAGLIRAARAGTLFMDEVGELGLDLQPKLLRFLESGEIAPLGESGPLTIDVRIVAATNTNLEDAVRTGKFREDLFYRLNVVRLSIRPLRERRDEIPAFVNRFVGRAAEEFNKGQLTVAEETMERLLLYRWPGNVRQLQNEVRRMVALAEPSSTLLPSAISDDILGTLPVFRREGVNGSEISVSVHDKLLPTLARVECEMIKAALRQHHGKVNAVAKALGISRKGLYLKRQRFGL